MSRKKSAKKIEDSAEYVYSFELTKHYPSSRSYLLKKPLKKSFRDSAVELIFGKK
ncbi:hypothetical protein GF318_04655 [Candidatus Micrarchaeota archaeon]|nr:hypothetical protein [Candidatus Micrarchaeota archaeon]